MVVGVGIAPTYSDFQPDAHLSKPSNLKNFGEDDGTRTRDNLIDNQAHLPLCYVPEIWLI